MAGVRHQHAIAAGKAQIGGECRALVPALFLDHLDEQHLTPLDDILNLVAATQRLPLAAQFIGRAFIRSAYRFLGLGRNFLVALIGSGIVMIALVEVGFGSIQRLVLDFVVIARFLCCAQALLLGRMLRFLAQQCLAILFGDLIIIRMNFREGQETVAVTTIIDERRLQRGFDPGYLGEIDISLELPMFGRFEIELLNPTSLDDCHPGFFLVARVD